MNNNTLIENYRTLDQDLLSLMENNGTSDEYLASLLRFPLESSTRAVSSSYGTSTGPVLPLSFEKPFDETSLEPRCFRPHITSIDPAPLSKSSLKKETEDLELGKSLVSLLCDSTDDIVLKKRSSDKLLSAMFVPSQFKRQRVSAHFPSKRSVRRFRPSQDHRWRVMFQNLVNFKLKHGHSCVPHSYQGDPILARWVKRQRYQYKKFEENDATSTMTTFRIEHLNSIGFVWHLHESAWRTKFNELKAFQQRNGHCNVPSSECKNLPLVAWIRCQRRQCSVWRSGSNNTTMTAERHELLESLGFACEAHKSI